MCIFFKHNDTDFEEFKFFLALVNDMEIVLRTEILIQRGDDPDIK